MTEFETKAWRVLSKIKNCDRRDLRKMARIHLHRPPTGSYVVDPGLALFELINGCCDLLDEHLGEDTRPPSYNLIAEPPNALAATWPEGWIGGSYDRPIDLEGDQEESPSQGR